MSFNGHGDKFSHWISSGLLATVAWFFVLIIYCTFRAFGIEDPLLGQAFLLLTGAWVGNLTLAQGKKQAKTEERNEQRFERGRERIDQLEEDAARVGKLQQQGRQRLSKLEGRAETSEKRADDSEDRETEWSRHKDHTEARHGDHTEADE